MCAAPGGKTTYMMSMLSDYDEFIAVDKNSRIPSLEFQLKRLDSDHSVKGCLYLKNIC